MYFPPQIFRSVIETKWDRPLPIDSSRFPKKLTVIDWKLFAKKRSWTVGAEEKLWADAYVDVTVPDFGGYGNRIDRAVVLIAVCRNLLGSKGDSINWNGSPDGGYREHETEDEAQSKTDGHVCCIRNLFYLLILAQSGAVEAVQRACENLAGFLRTGLKASEERVILSSVLGLVKQIFCNTHPRIWR